jgi:hypothetical protein
MEAVKSKVAKWSFHGQEVQKECRRFGTVVAHEIPIVRPGVWVVVIGRGVGSAFF